MIGNKIADKIKKAPRTLPHSSSEIVTNEAENTGLDRENLKKDIYLQKKDRNLLMI